MIGNRYASSIALAALAALLSRAHPADAICADPTVEKATAEVKTGYSALSPVGAHPVLGRSVLASGTTVDVVSNETLVSSGTKVFLTGDAQNTPNPVLLDDGKYAVFIAQADGVVTRIDIDESTGVPTTNWTRNLRRGGCSDDSLSATPSVHLRRFASETFRATYGSDLVYVPTRYGGAICGGDATQNKVHALNVADGSDAWVFNSSNAVNMDIVSEAAFLDIEDDRLFVASERTASPLQHSLWAIDVITGTAAWSAGAGQLQTTPMVRGETIYVGTVTGEVKALNKDDGTVLWSVSLGFIPITTNVFAEFRPPYADLIGVVDLLGTVALVRDDGTAGTKVWTSSLSAAATSRVAFDPDNGKVYVGADDGKIYQLNIIDGAVEASRLVDAGGRVGDATYVFEDTDDDAVFDTLSMIAGSDNGFVRKFCAPWAAMGVPFAPLPDESSFALPPGGCSVDSDCGAEPSKCAVWKCSNKVCAADPLPLEGSTCDDANDFTAGDVCKSGVCVGLSECQTNFDACRCEQDDGSAYVRDLMTLELSGGDLGEVVETRSSNACMTLVEGATRTIVWVHLFDMERRPFTNAKVVMTIVGGSGTAPHFRNPKTGATTSATSISTSSSGVFVIESDRPGTYYGQLESKESGVPSDPSEAYIIQIDAAKSVAGVTCIDTEGRGETLQTTLRIADPVVAELGGCRLFGDIDETGTVRIEVAKSGGGMLPWAPVQLGLAKDVNAFYSSYGEFISLANPAGDTSNQTLADASGIAFFEDFGNYLDGSNDGTATFFVQATCPGGFIGDASTVTFELSSAVERIVLSC
jgi:outer membrane protein assembly factor BamB